MGALGDLEPQTPDLSPTEALNGDAKPVPSESTPATSNPVPTELPPAATALPPGASQQQAGARNCLQLQPSKPSQLLNCHPPYQQRIRQQRIRQQQRNHRPHSRFQRFQSQLQASQLAPNQNLDRRRGQLSHSIVLPPSTVRSRRDHRIYRSIVSFLS